MTINLCIRVGKNIDVQIFAEGSEIFEQLQITFRLNHFIQNNSYVLDTTMFAGCFIDNDEDAV